MDLKKQQLQAVIQAAYAAFNARHIPGVLQYMHPAVRWPNGWQGGWVQGHEGIRDYWTRQWRELDPLVVPAAITFLEDGRVAVDVKQTIKNLQGALLLDGMVKHIYTFKDGLIMGMEIEEG
jgi:hypothetical protein